MASHAKRKSKGEGKASKSKRKRKHSQSDDEGFLSSKYAEPPISKIYNSRIRHSAPAELFRKDLISAMKLPDNEPLVSEDYLVIQDSWRPEWEKGVQVPVDPNAIPENIFREKRKRRKDANFKLPKKLICNNRNEKFSPETHCLRFDTCHAEQICRYDLDDVDMEFLNMMNEDRDDFGLLPVDEHTMEKVIDEIETVCLENFQDALRNENGVGGDTDDDAICDVCRSPDSEEGNEIVFCDACNMCVHQSCYGIVKIPEGSWICRTCALNVRPTCIFCPLRGGAMKPTINGDEWCHVSCAIWMPEVSFQHVEKMEPITKVHLVPAFRWNLDCSLCPERAGACIQCSYKHCKKAYHVTCAVRGGLKMKAIMQENEDALKLKSFCHEHSKDIIPSTPNFNSPEPKNEMDFNDEVSYQIREGKLHEKESHFYNYVSPDEIAEICQLDKDIVEPIYNYWKLKRRANHNQPLLPPKDISTTKTVEESHTYTLVKKLVILRRDLERARNLCFMVKKREKLYKSWVNVKRDIYMKQLQILNDDSVKLTKEEFKLVICANQGDLIYDKIHTGTNGPSPNTLKVLNGLIGEENTKIQLNGILRMSRKQVSDQSKKVPNPYAKHYLNGLLKRSQRWLATVDRKKQEGLYALNDNLSKDENPCLKEDQPPSTSESLSHQPESDACDDYSSKDEKDHVEKEILDVSATPIEIKEEIQEISPQIKVEPPEEDSDLVEHFLMKEDEFFLDKLIKEEILHDSSIFPDDENCDSKDFDLFNIEDVKPLIKTEIIEEDEKIISSSDYLNSPIEVIPPETTSETVIVKLEDMNSGKPVKIVVKPVKDLSKKHKKEIKNNIKKHSKKIPSKEKELPEKHKKKKKKKIDSTKNLSDPVESSKNCVLKNLNIEQNLSDKSAIESKDCYQVKKSQGIYLNDKLLWGDDLNPKVVLMPLEISDTDTGDSILQKDLLLNNEHVEKSTKDSQIEETVNSKSYASKKEPIKQEDSPNTKNNKLVEHIMKESSSDKSDKIIKDSPFPNANLPRKGSLTGYKIPKKKAKPETDSVENKRGNSPLSPLTDRVSTTTTTVSPLYCNNNNSYQKWTQPKCTWKPLSSQKPVDPPPRSSDVPSRSLINGDLESHRPSKNFNKNCTPAPPPWRPSFPNHPRPPWGRNFPQRMRHPPPNLYLEDPRLRPYGRGHFPVRAPRMYHSPSNT